MDARRNAQSVTQSRASDDAHQFTRHDVHLSFSLSSPPPRVPSHTGDLSMPLRRPWRLRPLHDHHIRTPHLWTLQNTRDDLGVFSPAPERVH